MREEQNIESAAKSMLQPDAVLEQLSWIGDRTLFLGNVGWLQDVMIAGCRHTRGF